MDEQPEREAVRHSAVDGVEQSLPRRAGTLPGFPATRLPDAPRVPVESAATVPAPNPLQRQTIRRPTPPSAARQARRSGPPPGSESPVPAEPTSGQPAPSTPLPPPSRSPAEARIAAQERELARLRRERDEAREQVRRAAESIRPDGSIESLRKAQTKLYIGIAAALVILAAPLAAYLTAAAEANSARSERAAAQAGNAVSAADSAKATASNADKEIAKLRAELAQYRANMREVLRLQGIDVAKRAGDPDPNDLDPVVPFCPRGKVCPGPSLELRNPP